MSSIKASNNSQHSETSWKSVGDTSEANFNTQLEECVKLSMEETPRRRLTRVTKLNAATKCPKSTPVNSAAKPKIRV